MRVSSLDPEMVLKKSIHETRNFLHKTLGDFKSFFHGRYKKISKPIFLNPFCCGRKLEKYHQTDQFYDDFYQEWESNLKIKDSLSRDSAIEKENASSESFVKFSKQIPKQSKPEEECGLKGKKPGESYSLRQEEMQSSCLARRMREFEMVDSGDVEQKLDVEEALHYYSRLKSPAYVDIVDKFFMDMYSDFSIPVAAAVNNHHSKRRLGSQRLGAIKL